MSGIDWSLAQRVGEMVAGTPPAGAVLGAPATPVSELTERIGSYTGLAANDPPPPLEVVDRPRWIAANLRTMRPLLEPMTDRVSGSLGPLSGMARYASGLALGAQVGALTGMLSQRVLGQYEVALTDPAVRPRLLLVAPNLIQASANLSVDRGELVKWVTIHEVTHAVQFSGAPWLRGHLGGIVGELIGSLQVSMGDGGDGRAGGFRLGDLIAGRDLASLRAELGELVARARRGELMQMTLGEDRWRLVEQMQSAMSLIEGHAEHVMDAVGAEMLPSLPRLRSALTRRRASRPLPWRVLERLLGLELKMRQYEVGRRFCDRVIAEGGTGALAPAWRSPEGLPTMAELDSPLIWLQRVGG